MKKGTPIPLCKTCRKIRTKSTSGNCWTCDSKAAEARRQQVLQFIEQAQQIKARAGPPGTVSK